jgi:hypothetical protein
LSFSQTFSFSPAVITPNTLRLAGLPRSASTGVVQMPNALPDTLVFEGQNFVNSSALMTVFLGPLNDPTLYTCELDEAVSTDTLATCLTPSNAAGLLLHFSVSIAGALSAPSNDTLIYPLAPHIDSVEGCPNDAAPKTANCPTAGGRKITIRGQRFAAPVIVLVSGAPCAPVQKGTPSAFAICTLPASAGADVTVSLVSNNQVRLCSCLVACRRRRRPTCTHQSHFCACLQLSNVVRLLSYAAPTVSSLSSLACSPATPSLTLLNCHRTGLAVLTINGQNFGKVSLSASSCHSLVWAVTPDLSFNRLPVFQAGATVFIGNAQCSNAVHATGSLQQKRLTCLLPAMALLVRSTSV